MTKPRAVKKVRRSSGVKRNGGNREPKSDTPLRKQAAKKDVVQLFAEKVRDHKDLESRRAVLEEIHVEYFRGKGFVSFLKNHEDLKDVLESDKKLEVEDIANILLIKNLIVRCDRVVKTVRLGRRKLSTWPSHLEIFTDQVFSENDAFFVWTFVKRRPLWQTLLSFFWPVLMLAICLFPLYPHRAKLLIFYCWAGILLLIIALLLVRAAIFGAILIMIGKRVWFFPNILAEEATLSELFVFWPKKDEGERPKWTARLFYAIVAVLVVLLGRHHAADEAARASLTLSGMMEKQQTLVNLTPLKPNNNFTDGSTASSEKADASDDIDGDEVILEHYMQEEDTGNIDDNESSST